MDSPRVLAIHPLQHSRNDLTDTSWTMDDEVIEQQHR